jgi:hypothetical protein
MTEDRQMMVEAVVQGLIGEEHLTIEEINETIELLCDLSIEKGLDEAKQRGCFVFSGSESELLH